MIIRRNKKNRKIKNRKKQSWLSFFRKVVFWLIFILFWGVSLWTLFFSDVMKVTNVESVGDSENFSSFHVEQHVGEIISRKFLGLIPRDNLLLISKKSIVKEIKESHGLIRDVSVERRFPNTIVIGIEERESHIIWCNNEICVLLDERGEAFGDVEDFDGEKDVRVFDTSNKKFELGDRVAEPEFVFFSEKLPDMFFEELSIEIEPTLQTPSSMSGEIRLKTKDGWEGMFSTNRPMGVQMKVMKKILKEKIGPEKVSQLEYIDLRIKGKAMYKFKQEEEKNENEEDEKEVEEER
ncbi:MAG: FtsQ-type POTRA domain-containing protein [Patescibacteria group bacterium]|nr:FtsQ-type POTRA domain-containing protein [Patescibacteria group bacterium]